MASYHYLLQQSKPHFESPAKVFAKLKSKVQREAYERTFADSDAQRSVVGEKHGHRFHSPRRRKGSADEFKENQRLGNIYSEVRAVTLSPISSPQKNLGFSYSDFSSRPDEDFPPLMETGHALNSRHGYTPTKRAFLESTAVSYHPTKTLTERPLIGDLDGFNVTDRPSIKTRPRENKVSCGRSVFEGESAPLHDLTSPDAVFSPVAKRLRKRKWEQQELNNAGNRTHEINYEGRCQPKERKSAAFIEENTYDSTCTEDAGACPHPGEPLFAIPGHTAKTWCSVRMSERPPMSPAKMFAYMKERESKKEQLEVPEVSSARRELFDGDHQCQSSDKPHSTEFNTDRMEDIHFGGAQEHMLPASPPRTESSDCQSDLHPLDDAPLSAVPSQPVLLEDPLVLNSPRITIPKKQEAVFKPNKWPQRATFPSESVIYLKKWFLRKTHKGLFVDGIHGEDDIPWNSNIIVDRVSSSVLKTVSGRVYILVGKMNLSVESEFPKWFLKKFANGFPANWTTLYETFLSKEETKTKGESRSRAKTKTEPSTINLSVKRCRQKALKTPDSCPSSAVSHAKMSRSGRLIKPPLEYWKGGRVILDAQMNVTIHECYDTSICNPQITATVTTKSSQKPPRVILTESYEQCDSAGDTRPSAPVRKVKAPFRNRNRIKGNPEGKASSPPEPPVEAVTHQNNNPEDWSNRITRSSQKSHATQRTIYADSASKKQSEPERSSTQRSKKQTQNTNSTSVKGRRQTVSSESPTVSDNTSPGLSTDKESSFSRKTRGKAAHRKKGANVLTKAQPSYVSPSSQSSDSSGNSGKQRKKKSQKRVAKSIRTAQTQTNKKQSKYTKTSSPPKFTQSSKTRGNKSNTDILQEEDEDEWTETELMKLQEAASCYPKHIGGYWAKVAKMVGTRSAEECHNQHTSMRTSKTPAKKDKKPKRKKEEPPKDPAVNHPVISARVGTLKRKQQVRDFLEAMPREDVDDVFSSAYMQGKRFEMPSMCPSEDHDFTMSDLEPRTPMSTGVPEVKTPQCLHITPGMMGSPSRNNDDKYVYQLQKRMKKNRFSVHAPPSKSFTPTPSVKRTMKRCGTTENNTFVVWEMFPNKDGALSESGEEEDFYFSDND